MFYAVLYSIIRSKGRGIMLKTTNSTDKKGISVYVTPTIYESLSKLAVKNGRSLSNMAALIIKESIEGER